MHDVVELCCGELKLEAGVEKAHSIGKDCAECPSALFLSLSSY